MGLTSRWFLNAGLLVLLAALALVIWFQPGAQKPAPQPAITDLEASAVDTIRIEQPGHDTAVFKREHGHWRMIEPVAARADDGVIATFLDDINEESTRHYPVKGLNLAEFGLKPPKLSLTLNGQQLDFGGTESLNHQRYIRNGDTVYLVNDTLFYRLQGDPLSLLSKRLLPKDAKITALVLPDIKLAQDAKGDWQLTPPNAKITSDQIQKLIDHWHNAQAFNVKAAGETPVGGKVKVALAGHEKPIVFEVLKTDAQLALVRPDLGIRYALPATRHDDLLKLTPQKETASKDEKTPSQPSS